MEPEPEETAYEVRVRLQGLRLSVPPRAEGPARLVTAIIRDAGLSRTGPTLWHLPVLGHADIRQVVDFRRVAPRVAQLAFW